MCNTVIPYKGQTDLAKSGRSQLIARFKALDFFLFPDVFHFSHPFIAERRAMLLFNDRACSH